MLGFNDPYTLSVILVVFSIGIVLIVNLMLFGQLIATLIATKKRQERADLETARTAIAAIEQCRFPAVFIRFSDLVAIGRFEKHEVLRDKGLLRFLDSMSEAKEFTNDNPTLFVSHQWLGFKTPDPQNAHYEA